MTSTQKRLSAKEATSIAVKWTRQQTDLPAESFVTPRKYSQDKHGRIFFVMKGNFFVMKILICDDKSVKVIRDRRHHHSLRASP